MSDIVLISAQQNLDTIGLKYIHQYLLKEKLDSILLYIPKFTKQREGQHFSLKSFLMDLNPPLIGISLTVEDYPVACEVTKIVREVLPKSIIIWGGIEPTTEPERCLQWADFVCMGEGEVPITEFTLAVKKRASLDELKTIKNFAYLEKGELKVNPLQPLITDMDSLPILRQIPERCYVDTGKKIESLSVEHLYKYKRYRGQVLKVMTSRGCPYGCTYCCNRYLRKIYGKWPIRQRSVNHVIKEIELGLAEGPKTLYVDIADDCFFASDIDYIKEFCYEYKKRFNIPFIAKTTPHEVSDDRMQILIDAGMTWINMGLQSGSDQTCLRTYKRPTTSSTFLEAAKIINNYPIGIYYDVIVDNPYESYEDELKTAETLAKVPGSFVPLIASLRFYPGTELRKRAIADQLIDASDIQFDDIFAWKNKPINKLIQSACFLPTKWTLFLIGKFKRQPQSRILYGIIHILNLFSKAVLMPLTALRMIYRSQRCSVLGTIKTFPMFFNANHLPFVQSFRKYLPFYG